MFIDKLEDNDLVEICRKMFSGAEIETILHGKKGIRVGGIFKSQNPKPVTFDISDFIATKTYGGVMVDDSDILQNFMFKKFHTDYLLALEDAIKKRKAKKHLDVEKVLAEKKIEEEARKLEEKKDNKQLKRKRRINTQITPKWSVR